MIWLKLLKAIAKVIEEMRNLDSYSPAFLHHLKEKLLLSAKLLVKRWLHLGHFIMK